MRESTLSMPLDSDQLRVVAAPVDCHIRVLSTPGGGKSSVLIARVCHLIEKCGEDPAAMRVMSFSRQSAADVAARMPDGVQCSTIHSFCSALSARAEPLYGVPAWGADTLEDDAARELFSPDEFLFRLRDFLAEGRCEAAMIAPLRFLFVDEMQDLCPVQFEIISHLGQQFGVRVFGVGDVRQNIYAFRSSDSRFLKQMESLPHYPCISFELTKNYRSLRPIIAFSNRLIKGGTHMTAVREAKYERLPTLTCLDSKARELGWLADRVEDALRCWEPQEVAVITRNQKDAYLISHKLVERGIKNRVVIEGGSRGGDVSKSARVVSVCTMHGSKGLEWPVVFLSNMSDSYNKSLVTATELQQEENLTFVAATRARDELHLTSPGKAVSRVIARVPREAYVVTEPDKEEGIVPPYLSSSGQDPFARSDRSVTAFVRHCSGETYRLMKDTNLLPRRFPGASLLRLHAAHPFPEEFNEAKELYGSIVERVVFRQLDRRVRQAGVDAGSSQALLSMQSPDAHANACFLYVRTDPPSWDKNPPTDKEVVEQKKALADSFGLTPNLVAEVDINSMPAYLKSKEILYCKKVDKHHAAAFNRRIEDLKEAYKHFIADDLDLSTEEGLRVVSEVALCSHLCFSPAKTHLLFRRPVVGALETDANLGLFQQTARVVDRLVTEHFALDPAPIVEDPTMVGDAGFMLRTFGVASDIDISIPSVKGICDIVINHTMLEIKASEEPGGVQISWVLQLMIYAALASERGLDIREIAVYNPLKGFLWRAPISNWTKGPELLRLVAEQTSSKVEPITGRR